MADWTDSDLEILRREWAAGTTCSNISKVLRSKFSRGAVIGKVQRLKLAPRRTETVPAKPRKPKSATHLPPKRRPTPKAMLPVRVEQPPVLALVAPTKPIKPKRYRERLGREFNDDNFFRLWVSGLMPAASDIQRIPGAFECKWITGDVREPDARWCRKPCVEGKPWCVAHNLRAYDRNTPRRRS